MVAHVRHQSNRSTCPRHGARWIAACALAALAGATELVAQEPSAGRASSSGRTAPLNWMTISAGFMASPAVPDGTTTSTWDFGSSYPVKLTAERTVAQGVTLGVAVSYVRAPLVYFANVPSSACGACNAHATVATYGVLGHYNRNARGFGQVFEVFLGALQYGNFERDTPRGPLSPDKANVDFAFSVSYGFEYAFTSDWRLELIQDYMNAVHERENLPGNAQTLARFYLTRLVLRVGF
jgi:hypothetical protein